MPEILPISKPFFGLKNGGHHINTIMGQSKLNEDNVKKENHIGNVINMHNSVLIIKGPAHIRKDLEMERVGSCTTYPEKLYDMLQYLTSYTDIFIRSQKNL